MADEDAPPAAAAEDPFEAWYRDTIQANPDKYDTGRSKAQWQAWYPRWTGGGFSSSKTDTAGNPIQGSFDHPDECPPGTSAYGQSMCAPTGYHGAGGGGGGRPGGGGGGGGAGDPFMGLGGYGPFAYSGEAYPTFTAPTEEDVFSDPGYQFRLKQGTGALEASAAARGNLNSGGTLQDLVKFGQDYGSQEYGKAFDRSKDLFSAKVGAYNRNYGDQWSRYQFNVDDEFRREGLVSGINPAY